jgi:hypothetical protein
MTHAKTPVYARLSDLMRAEFLALHKKVKEEAPEEWKEPSHGDLVGALVVLARDAQERVIPSLGTYLKEKRR